MITKYYNSKGARTFEIGGDCVARCGVHETSYEASEGVKVSDHGVDVKVIVLCTVCLFSLDRGEHQEYWQHVDTFHDWFSVSGINSNNVDSIPIFNVIKPAKYKPNEK